ncbi:hypothetical protein BDW69DRAFT_186816 [Aspergillus filifer]
MVIFISSWVHDVDPIYVAGRTFDEPPAKAHSQQIFQPKEDLLQEDLSKEICRLGNDIRRVEVQQHPRIFARTFYVGST